MYKLLHDAEREVSILLGGPDNMIADLEHLEPDVKGAVVGLAERLGLGDATTDTQVANIAFDLVNHALAAVADAQQPAGHAHAGTPEQAAPAAPQTPQEPVSQPETAPVSETVAKAQETADALSAPVTPGAEQAPPPPNHPTPVTTPQPGNTICPTCDGWRTVVGAGDKVVECPTCHGKGEVPAHQEPQTPGAAA